MKRVPKPWGYELHWIDTDKYISKVLHINAGQALSLQYHTIKDEAIMVQYGRVQLEYFTEKEGIQNRHILDMVPGDSFHIPAGLRHRISACQNADVVEVSTPHRYDVVRLEDRYGRANIYTDPTLLVNDDSLLTRFFRWLFKIKK